MPDLAPFISLIGAVFYSILGLLCPAVIHLAVFWHGRGAGADGDSDSESEDDGSDCDADYHAVDEEADGGAAIQRAPRRIDGGVAARRARRRIDGGGATDPSKGAMSRWTAFKDIVIIVLALIALVSGTYISLVNIMVARPVNDATTSAMTVGLMSGSIFKWPQTWTQ